MGLLDFLVDRDTKVRMILTGFFHEYCEEATNLRSMVASMRNSIRRNGVKYGVTVEMFDRGIELINEEINKSYKRIEMLLAEGKTKEEVMAEVGTSRKVEYDWDWILRGYVNGK